VGIQCQKTHGSNEIESSRAKYRSKKAFLDALEEVQIINKTTPTLKGAIGNENLSAYWINVVTFTYIEMCRDLDDSIKSNLLGAKIGGRSNLLGAKSNLFVARKYPQTPMEYGSIFTQIYSEYIQIEHLPLPSQREVTRGSSWF